MALRRGAVLRPTAPRASEPKTWQGRDVGCLRASSSSPPELHPVVFHLISTVPAAACCLTFPRMILSYQNTRWQFLCITLAVALGFGAVPEEAVGLYSPQAIENVLSLTC